MLKTLQAKDRHEIRHNRRRSGKSPEQGYVVARLALKLIARVREFDVFIPTGDLIM